MEENSLEKKRNITKLQVLIEFLLLSNKKKGVFEGQLCHSYNIVWDPLIL